MFVITVYNFFINFVTDNLFSCYVLRVEKLKIFFPRHNTDSIKKTACTFEHKIYGMAKDKVLKIQIGRIDLSLVKILLLIFLLCLQNDYLRKIHEMIIATEKKFRTGGTSANGANTPDQGL